VTLRTPVFADIVRERGPITVAAFMELALYDPDAGYYARAARRSGRAGDFFTSVDVGAVFGRLIERQLAEMAGVLATSHLGTRRFDLVEAGAGDGRLAADVLRAARQRHPDFYERIALHLVEQSPGARAGQSAMLGEVGERLVHSSAELPAAFEGVLLANELLDALPVHQVVMREGGLREVYVEARDDRLVTCEGAPSTPDLAAYLERLGARLRPGWRAEINLRAVAWVQAAARRLQRGFVILIDYGHEARDLYSATHARGTLTSLARHVMQDADRPGDSPPWLRRPGRQDVTSHVDFTSVRTAAEREGLTTLGFLDQTYFLLGVLTGGGSAGADASIESDPELSAFADDARALKTLILPGGLGSTHKVLVLGKGVGTPRLRGCSYRMRVT
jgi:SAM-dependent MidA family methyltransferase